MVTVFYGVTDLGGGGVIAVLLESGGPVASPQVYLGLRCDQKWIMTAGLSLGM